MCIAHELGLYRHTVEKYVRMMLVAFHSSQSCEWEFKYKLDIYEDEVKNELSRAPYLSSRQIHDQKAMWIHLFLLLTSNMERWP